MNPNWWGTPSTAESKYINTRLSPSWAESPATESPTRPRVTAEQWALVTNQKQSEPKMTTDLYGNPLPPVASQRHRSTVAPSSLDPRNCSQIKTAFYAKIVKDASNGESCETMTVLNMTVVQLKTFQLQLKMLQLQVQFQARMDLNVNHQGRLLILMQKGQHLRVIPVRC
ncbi:hypothetical protein HanHA300_Chr10g0379061 [Helianthus annuus]|nr:hypothetical protein HanHA300_Chr10g0379061 [Helianthus annuus]KAJ0531489.1 hypothetical protein HanHA89_Chr10g0401641 [Helianthus annuus]KAJ0698329.1 hypothetical protein HanLR1_Chr10g0378851 [Helianthus annuus]